MTFVVYFIYTFLIISSFYFVLFFSPFPTFLPFFVFLSFPSSPPLFVSVIVPTILPSFIVIRTCRNCVRSAVPSLASSGDGGQTESLMSPVKQPPHRSPSDTEALVTSAPSGTVQGPVIYAQLDHSGKAGDQINKSETVVYADIRKNC